jgi:putative aminopeptidase FrvX
MNSIEIIKAFVDAFGPPGFEDEVNEVARKLAPKGANIIEDNIRNLYICPTGQKKENAPTVLIDAHSDEVGLMVRAIKENGTLAFVTLGGWIPAVLSAQKVLIRNVRGELVPGVVASKPPHFDRSQDSPLHIEDMVIDIGAMNKTEAIESFGMAVACPIVPWADFYYDKKHDIIMAKALDCRLGCASLIETMHKVAELDLAVNVVGVLTSQEETGIRGAKVAVNRTKPDLAICFEGTPADDTFGSPELMQTALKKGPMLRHIDLGMITNPRFMRLALDVAKEQNIPVQEAIRTGGATNGSAFHLSNLGIPTIVIGHPSRYVHSPASMSSLEDYKNGTRLAIEILKVLNKEKIERM